MGLLTQSQVIEELGNYATLKITQSSFSKRVKRGQIKFHYKPNSKKKFYKLHEVAKVYDIKIHEIESSTSSDIKEDEDIFTSENLEQLNTLLKDADTPMTRVSIIDTFWAGKIKEAKYKEAIRQLIPMEEALGVIQVGVTNFKTKMYEIPHQLKAQFPDATTDMIDELHTMIDKAFYEFSKTSIRE